MKQKDFSSFAADKQLDGSAIKEFSKLLRIAKQRAVKAQEAENAVFVLLENMIDDLQAKTNAENATTIEEAITCYLSYDEYTHKDIVREVKELYESQWDK